MHEAERWPGDRHQYPIPMAGGGVIPRFAAASGKIAAGAFTGVGLKLGGGTQAWRDLKARVSSLGRPASTFASLNPQSFQEQPRTTSRKMPPGPLQASRNLKRARRAPPAIPVEKHIFDKSWRAASRIRPTRTDPVSNPSQFKTMARTRSLTRVSVKARSKRAGKTKYSRGKYANKVHKWEHRYPQIIKQKYWLTNPNNYMTIAAPNAPPGQVQGTVINATGLYSTDALTDDSASVVVLCLNNTEAHWSPDTNPAAPYRTGIQLCGTTGHLGTDAVAASPNDSFIWTQNPTNDDLISKQSPMYQSGLSETAVDVSVASSATPYTIPNTVLKSTSVDLTVWNPYIRGQTFSIKLIRANTNVAVRSGTFGEAIFYAAKNIRIMTNSQSFTNDQEFSTLWTHTFQMPGLRNGTALKKYKIKKSFNLEFLRSQYRKVFPAESTTLNKLAMQAEPSFAFDPGFFNGCYFVLSSKLNTDDVIADVTQPLAPATTGSIQFPQITLPFPGIAGQGFTQLPRGAQFAYSGVVHVEHRVQSIRRHLPLTTLLAISPLELRLKALEDAAADDHHVHDVKVPKNHNKTRTTSPVEIPEETMSE